MRNYTGGPEGNFSAFVSSLCAPNVIAARLMATAVHSRLPAQDNHWLLYQPSRVSKLGLKKKKKERKQCIHDYSSSPICPFIVYQVTESARCTYSRFSQTFHHVFFPHTNLYQSCYMPLSYISLPCVSNF